MTKDFIDGDSLHLIDKSTKLTYVYVDWTLESVARPFYVGLGDYGRVFQCMRNDLHAEIVKNFGIRRVVNAAYDTMTEANELEIKLTAELKTRAYVDGHFGANKTRGGSGTAGYKHTKESIDNMRAARPNKRPVVQYSLSGVVIAAFESQREAQRITAVPQSNIKACCQRKLKSAGKFIWRYEGDSFDPKLRVKVRPHTRPKNRKPVEQLTLDGALVATFNSIHEAVELTGVSNVGACVTQVRKHAGGYLWRYAI